MNYSKVEVEPSGALRVADPEDTLDLNPAKRRFSLLLWGALILVLTILVFASYDTYKCTPLTEKLNSRLIEPANVTTGWLSYFELSVLGCTILLLERFGFRFLGARPILKMLFLFAAACLVLDVLNPNDEGMKILGLPIRGNVSAMLYLIFMFAVFFIREEGFLVFLRRAALVACVLIVIRTTMLLGLWAVGMGNYNFGAGATLTEGDSLMVVSFFTALFLALYFIRRKLVYLLAWVMTVALIVLSFRRSGLYIVIGSNVFILMLQLLIRARLARIIRNLTVVTFAGIVGALVVMGTVSEDTQQYYFNRYFGMFMGMGQQAGSRDAYAGDSGHFDESAATMMYAVDKMNFWGYGGGTEDRINIPGATKQLWVHNVFAASWLYHGVYQFLFYATLCFITILMALKIFFQRKRFDDRFVLLMGCIVSFLIMMMVVWYSNPIHMAEALKLRLLWVTLLACLFRLTPQNFGALFEDQGAPEEISGVDDPVAEVPPQDVPPGTLPARS